MLDFLPNEVLVKIFKKTNSSTNRQCRLLNSRIKSVIERDTLQKKELRIVEISDPKALKIVVQQACSAVHKRFEDPDGLSFTYPQMQNVNWTRILEKYRPPNQITLGLNKMHITKELVDKLAQFELVNNLDKLAIYKCRFNIPECTDLVYLLEKIKVKSLSIEPGSDKEYIIPNDIFRCVSDNIRITPEKYDIRNRHFDDELLDKWFTPEKSFVIGWFPTGFTVNGIKKQLQKLYTNLHTLADRECHFGIIFDDVTEFDKMLRTFDKISLTKSNISEIKLAFLYEISSLNGKECRILFMVVHSQLQ